MLSDKEIMRCWRYFVLIMIPLVLVLAWLATGVTMERRECKRKKLDRIMDATEALVGKSKKSAQATNKDG